MDVARRSRGGSFRVGEQIKRYTDTRYLSKTLFPVTSSPPDQLSLERSSLTRYVEISNNRSLDTSSMFKVDTLRLDKRFEGGDDEG